MTPERTIRSCSERPPHHLASPTARDVLGDGDRYDTALWVGFTGDPVESVWVFPPNYYVERAVPGLGREDR